MGSARADREPFWLRPAQGAIPTARSRLNVPLAAAGALDVVARIVTQRMADHMGQQFVILNLPGDIGADRRRAGRACRTRRRHPFRLQRRHCDNSADLKARMRVGTFGFRAGFLVATVEWGLNQENEAEFSSACLRPRDFSDARVQEGRDASGEQARSSTVFSG